MHQIFSVENVLRLHESSRDRSISDGSCVKTLRSATGVFLRISFRFLKRQSNQKLSVANVLRLHESSRDKNYFWWPCAIRTNVYRSISDLFLMRWFQDFKNVTRSETSRSECTKATGIESWINYFWWSSCTILPRPTGLFLMYFWWYDFESVFSIHVEKISVDWPHGLMRVV